MIIFQSISSYSIALIILLIIIEVDIMLKKYKDYLDEISFRNARELEDAARLGIPPQIDKPKTKAQFQAEQKEMKEFFGKRKNLMSFSEWRGY